jgi:hypothetical protein
MITQLHQDLATILEDIWLNIDWSKVKAVRQITIWSEFEGQIQIRANQHSKVSEFLTKLCDRMDSQLTAETTSNILSQYSDYEILNAFRNEIQIILLLLKLKREKEKEENKKDEKKYQLFLDKKPELELDGIKTFKQAKQERPSLFEEIN